MAEAVQVAASTPADPAAPPAGAKETPTGVAVDTTQQPVKGEALILGKFKNQDELARAYQELESKQGTKPAEAPKPEAVKKSVEDAGFDLTALGNEVVEKGELSAETLTKLEAKGISKETAESLVAGMKAQATLIATELQKVAGGEENYKKALDWFQANQSNEDVQAFNDAIGSGNAQLAKLAVKGLMSDYNAAVGTDGNMVNGTNAGSAAGIKPFESQYEITEAMKDPRYKNGDTAYMEQVYRRLEKTKILG